MEQWLWTSVPRNPKVPQPQSRGSTVRLQCLPKVLGHPCSGRNFLPPSFFAAKITILSPLPPSYNVESIAEALIYLERHHFPLQCYLYHLHTTLLYGGGNLLFVYMWAGVLRATRTKTVENHCSRLCLHLYRIKTCPLQMLSELVVYLLERLGLQSLVLYRCCIRGVDTSCKMERPGHLSRG